MASWGMNQPNACSNCSIQLGNQMYNITLNGGATMAPCLHLFVRDAQSMGKKREEHRKVCLCECVCLWVGGWVKWSIPQSPPSLCKPIRRHWANQAQSQPQNKATHACFIQLYLSAACLLILICIEAILSPHANWVSQWAADFFEVTVGKYA